MPTTATKTLSTGSTSPTEPRDDASYDEYIASLVALKRIAASRAYAFADPEVLSAWLNTRATPDSMIEKLARPNGTMITLYTDHLVGCVFVEMISPDTACLSELYCESDSLGLGSFLFDRALAHAQASSAKRMILHCFEKNSRAQDFFTSRGFSFSRSVEATDSLGAGELFELSMALS